ncbi:MAG TPA: pyruvoyl-dependent arginine decarboxylase [Thermoproteota archaeon]|nr:pyruvoyl-dependent arginine decarboxylase [Thermoproteota archaeon]
MRQKLVPVEYFTVAGTGESDTSELNAFDRALVAAGISQCNLVPVSSILPKRAREIRPRKIEPGEVTFVVLGKATGKQGDHISAGVGIAYVDGGDHDIIAELNGNGGPEEIKSELSDLLQEMAAARHWKVSRVRSRVCDTKITRAYGVALAAVVLLL